MKPIKEYRQNARTCLEQSRKSSSLEVQAHWLAMAQYWFDLADEPEEPTIAGPPQGLRRSELPVVKIAHP